MLKIFHNPRCSKSRAGLNYLITNNLEHEIIDYLNINLSANDVEKLVKQTGLQVTDLVRTQEEYYKKNLKDNKYSNEEWYKIIAENPKLLQRPIVIKDEKGVFAQPPEKINDLI
ncbi:MAG: hypothetical protein JEZ09_09695 [Salinivirgaceae bacterium]|nr:hypothetical protein [Salinivirgaceae bacterium]